MEIFIIFISASVVNNFVLTYFLGICPFLGVSNKIDSSFSLGLATTFVMVITAVASWLINHYILILFNVPFLEYVSFIIVIASMVQLVEMFVKKTSPVLYRALGIFLPLITTNCAVLGVALLNIRHTHSFQDSVTYGLGAALGFSFLLIVFAAMRERLADAKVPRIFQGTAINIITAGLLSLAFMGFTGMH